MKDFIYTMYGTVFIIEYTEHFIISFSTIFQV